MSRYAYSIFCDDVRHEINGKYSLIGIYMQSIFIPSFPAVLPKLCAAVSVVSSKDNPFENLYIRGEIDGQSLFELNLDDQEIKRGVEQAKQDDADTITIQGLFVISPMSIQKPGKIKIQISSEGNEIPCPAITIAKAPEGMQLI